MKKFIFTSFIICLVASAFSQTDTIYTKKHQKIPCKITEINETEIKYKLAGLDDSPVYVVNKITVMKYRLSNGFSETLIPDELSLENEHVDIIKNRSVVKLHPFSVVNNQISVAYEKVLKVGMNLDIEAGYSNSNINAQGDITGNNQGYFNAGGYVKPGIKFFLGQDYSVKGLKYAHPLKGRYIKLDLGVSYLSYQNIKRVEYTSNPPYYAVIVTKTVTTNMNVVSYGGFVNYGRQFILGNLFTIEYYIGVGFTGLSYSYSNPEYALPKNNYYTGRYYNYYMEGRNVSNFHGFFRTPTLGLSFTGGFRIGFIIPEKKPVKQPAAGKTAN